MELIIESQRGGKTTKLIDKSAETGAYIVCHNMQEADRVFSAALKMGKNIPHPISADEFLKGQYYAKGVKSLLIDNADLFIQSISKVPIDAISLTWRPKRIETKDNPFYSEYPEEPFPK